MTLVPRGTFLGAAVLALALSAGPATASVGTPVANLTVYYTSYNFADPTAGAVVLNYDGNSTLTVTNPAPAISPFHFNTTAYDDVDGIAVGTDGNVYVTNSSAQGLTELSPDLAFIANQATTGGQQPYHISVDPTGSQLYAAVAGANDNPGGAAVLQVPNGLGAVISHDVVDNTSAHNPYNVTQISYDSANGKWYYSVANNYGLDASFGSITVTGSTFVATPLITGASGIHGLVYDPYTQKFIAVGGDQILEIDPTIAPIGDGSNLIVSSITETGDINQLDEGCVDGAGHILVSDNTTGDMVFIDYSQTGLLSTAGFVATPFIATDLDHVAVAAPVPLPPALPAGIIALGATAPFLARRTRRAWQRRA